MRLKPWAAWFVRHRMAWVLYAVLLMMAPLYLIVWLLVGAAVGTAEGIEYWVEDWRELAGHIRSVKSSKP